MAGQQNGVAVADQRGGRFEEHHGLLGHGALHLGRMRGVVAPDAQELARTVGLPVEFDNLHG